jgi:hypothetical protein
MTLISDGAGGDPAAAERRALLASLNAQRGHVLGILEGLADDALRQPVLPSGWTSLGLVQHLTLDDERFWFRGVIGAEESVTASVTAGEPNAWKVSDGVSASAVLDAYRQQSALADAVIAIADLDAAPAWWPADLFGDWRITTNRGVILHVITETACHAGHLDAARELLDGRQWVVNTD